MRILTREEVPCWYELSWREKESAIILRIHKDIVESIKPIPQDSPMAIGLMEEFSFASFAGNLNQDFGFESVFRFQEEQDDFVEFFIKIPVVRRKTDTPCDRCDGSGKDAFLEDRECLSCDGSGKEHIYDWKPAFAISASFTLLSRILEFPEEDTSAPLPQLLTVTTMTGKHMHGGSLGGTYGIAFCKWLRHLGARTNVPEVVQAMKVAYDRMVGIKEFDEHYFTAYIANENGWLNIDCPGDACGLNPSHGSIREERGYEFSCHNVDSPMQQITLLVGLAALHDKARKEIKN